MQFMTILALILAVGQVATPRPQTQPQRRSVGSAAFAIVVTDPSGAPLGDVKVTMTGPVSREVRTERGRIALENLPSGNYVLRFELEGFFSLEREVVARGGAPIDVKVILTPEPPPPPPPVPVIPPKPTAPAPTGEPVAIDMTSFIEKNYVGRGAGKISPLACAAGGAATLRARRGSRKRLGRQHVARIGDHRGVARDDPIARERCRIDAVADPPSLEMEMDAVG